MSEDITDKLYQLLVQRGFSQREAFAISQGPRDYQCFDCIAALDATTARIYGGLVYCDRCCGGTRDRSPALCDLCNRDKRLAAVTAVDGQHYLACEECLNTNELFESC